MPSRWRWAFASLLTLCLQASQSPDISYSESTVLTVNDGGKPSLRAHVEIEQTYLSKRSTDWTVFTVTEDSFARIQNLSGRVRAANLGAGSISHHFPQRRDVFISSEKIYQLEFPGDLKVGESVSYSYDQQFLDIAYLPMYQVPNLAAVKRFEIRVEHPVDAKVDFDLYYPGARLNPTILHPSPVVSILRFENLEHQPALSHMAIPGVQALILPRIQVAGVLLNPVTPERFSAWYLKLLEGVSTPEPEIPAELQAPLTQAIGPRQKLQVLFDYIKERIRYAADEKGVNAIVPRNPAFVLKRGFGDCKDKAFLLSHLARLLGIDLDLVLVCANHAPENFGLSVGLFNHMICRFEDKDGTVFMDPTSPYVEFGNLPIGDIHRSALALNAKRPQFVRIPYQRWKPSLELEIVGSLDEPRKASARVVLRNEFLAMAVYARRELRPLDLENKLSNSINQHLFKLSLDQFTLEREFPDAMEFKAVASLDEFLVKSPTRTYLPQIPFKTHEADLLKRKEDLYPIDVNIKPWIQLRIDLVGVGLQLKPALVQLGDPTTEAFEAKSVLTDKGARFSYETRPFEDYFADAAKTSYLEFFAKYLLQRHSMFAITRSNP
ncbi:MAG TPA: hypothetical protein VJ486_11875 [Geothrix sp.]|nr:hypothetical protein [Geothrix sp.]